MCYSFHGFYRGSGILTVALVIYQWKGRGVSEKEQLEKTQKYKELTATKNELKKNLKDLENKIASNFKH